MTVIEFRTRSSRLPSSFGGELRIWIGEAESRREETRLRHQREILKKLARRKQWQVLKGIKDGRYTVEQVARIADESGLDMVAHELRKPVVAPSIGELAEKWVETIEHDRTRYVYELDLGRLLDFVGRETPVTEVGSHTVDDAFDHLREEGLARNTLAGCRTAWSAFYTWFEERDRSLAATEGREPVLRIHPVRHSRKARTLNASSTVSDFMAPETFERLQKHAPKAMRPQYATLLYAGLRLGEFVHLRPQDVELPAKIRVRPHGPRESAWVPKGYPGHDHSVRDVPIHREKLLPLLEWYAEELAGERRFFTNPRTFGAWNQPTFRDQMERDCKAAGVPYGRKTEGGFTPHALRHTLASWLAQRDVQLMKIAQILGNTVQTTADYYARLLPKDLDETLNRVL